MTTQNPRSQFRGDRTWLPAARGRTAELARFGSVEAVAYVVDLGPFNLLRFGPGEILSHKPLTAKAISVAVATLVARLGNRDWSFSDRKTSTRLRELAGFVVVNIGGHDVPIHLLRASGLHRRTVGPVGPADTETVLTPTPAVMPCPPIPLPHESSPSDPAARTATLTR